MKVAWQVHHSHHQSSRDGRLDLPLQPLSNGRYFIHAAIGCLFATSTVIVARQCDVGLDKVSHQQYGRGGWLSGESNTAPGLTMSPSSAAVLLSARGRVPASCIVYTAVSDYPETRRAFRRASTRERHAWEAAATAGLAARHRAVNNCSHAHGVAHAMCLFLALDVKKVPTSLYFCSKLQPAGRRVIFLVVARTIM